MTILWSSYLHDGISYISELASLQIMAQGSRGGLDPPDMSRMGLHAAMSARWHLATWHGTVPTAHQIPALMSPTLKLTTGPRFNIKMTSYWYRKSHCGDKTILRPSYLHNGISYTGKTTSLYWIGAQLSSRKALQSLSNFKTDLHNCQMKQSSWHRQLLRQTNCHNFSIFAQILYTINSIFCVKIVQEWRQISVFGPNIQNAFLNGPCGFLRIYWNSVILDSPLELFVFLIL